MEPTTIGSALAKALVAFQSELTPVGKTASNPFFKSKYAPLPEVMETIQPLLAKHKLAVSQMMTHLGTEAPQSALRTIVLHESGESLSEVTPLLLTKSDPQAQGSAVTYARRYGVMAALGIVADEDDDGNAARAPQRQAPSAPAPKPATTPDDALALAKHDINDALEEQGYTAAVSKKAFITRVLKQSTIETIEQAHEVMDALDNEREVM